MYNITKNDNDISHGVKEFVCDTVDDLIGLPRCEMGSIAIVLSESAVYMKNGAGKWVKL
jgi:hypothetical protein